MSIIGYSQRSPRFNYRSAKRGNEERFLECLVLVLGAVCLKRAIDTERVTAHGHRLLYS